MIKKKLQKWLEIPKEQNFQIEFDKNLKLVMDKVLRDNKFWSQQLKARTPTKKCTKCKGQIEVWPFNDTVAYYIKGNRVTHQTCPSEKKK